MMVYWKDTRTGKPRICWSYITKLLFGMMVNMIFFTTLFTVQ